MADRKPLVSVSGKTKQLPAGDGLDAGPALNAVAKLYPLPASVGSLYALKPGASSTYSWQQLDTVIQRTEVVSSGLTVGQTVIPVPGGYTVGFIKVSWNGSRIYEFTATDGVNVTLTSGSVLSTTDEFIFDISLPFNPGTTATTFRTETVPAGSIGQTVFTVPGGYTPNLMFVQRGGVQLGPADFTATNGTTVTLADAAIAVGEEIRFIVFGSFLITDALSTSGTAFDSARLNGQTASFYATAADIATRPRRITETQAATSGTARTFLVPAGLTPSRVRVTLSGISSNGTSVLNVRVGTGGSPVAVGYVGTYFSQVSGAVGALSLSTGLLIDNANATTYLEHAIIDLEHLGGNLWTFRGVGSESSTNRVSMNNGSIPLAGAMDRVVLTAINGTDVFDGGFISVSWEG